MSFESKDQSLGLQTAPDRGKHPCSPVSPNFLNIFIFLGSLALVLLSSVVLGYDLDRIGHRLRLSEGLIGLLNALGADAPEISSAVAALLHHSPDIGAGVVLGSNIFNLAGLLGLSALIAGRVRVGRHGLLLDGSVGIAVTVLAGALIAGLLSPSATILLLVVLLAPYLAVFSMRPERVKVLPLPAPVRRFLDLAVVHIEHDVRRDQPPPYASAVEFLSLVPALLTIIVGSFWMVDAAVELGAHWRISQAVTGGLVLAGLTSIPNVVTAVRLALHGRGAAVLSETLNSNTMNLLAGFCIPAVFHPELARATRDTRLDIIWLLGMTVLAVAAAYVRGGLRRPGGLAIILMYAAFAALVAFRN